MKLAIIFTDNWDRGNIFDILGSLDCMHIKYKHITSQSLKKVIISVIVVLIISITLAIIFKNTNRNSDFRWLILIGIGTAIWSFWGLNMWFDRPKNKVKNRSNVQRLVGISAYKNGIRKNMWREDFRKKSIVDKATNLQEDLYRYLHKSRDVQLISVKEERWFLDGYLQLILNNNKYSFFDNAKHDYDELVMVAYVLYPFVQHYCHESKIKETQLYIELQMSAGCLVLSVKSDMELTPISSRLKEKTIQYHAHFTEEPLNFSIEDDVYKISIPMIA